uniref:Uncharacterized protein n=1 Tax=viral metagenome TaxID=1070528 RepID=A0A6M3IUC7_9ZZZZ
MLKTRLDIRTRVAADCRETQINSAIDEYINQTLQEINDPAWAFEQVLALRGYNHLWSFNRRKTTLLVSAETAQLPRDFDKMSLIRQIETPYKLRFIPDDLFYEYLPNPTTTGTPKWYRLWEDEGVEVRLASDDTIDIVSSSASDTSQTVRIVGYDTNGILQTESLSLNGITTVNGTITYDSNKVLRVSKSASTAGIITISANSVTLLKLAPTELSERFKIISLYPIPPTLSGSITAFADYSGTVTGTVSVTDASHGLATGQTITISGTTNYNGTYSITKIDDNTFYITATWVATETGTWVRVVRLYLEYYTRIRDLQGDNDVPDLDNKWIWVVKLGTMAKVYQYQNKETMFTAIQGMYASGVRAMVKSDLVNCDFIPTMRSRFESIDDAMISLPDSYTIT